MWQLVRLQFDLVTSFSVLPLRVTMAIGVATSALSMATAVVLVVGRLIYGHEWAVSGVFTLFAVLFALLGVLLFAIGLLGEYVGRIYMEVRHRPRFIVREVIRSDSAAVSEAPAGVEAAGAGVKAVVFGYHSMGCLGLEALLAHGFEVAAVLTHRDDPGEEVWWESLAEKARARGVPVLFPAGADDPAIREAVAAARPDFLFSFYFRWMIAPEVLALAAAAPSTSTARSSPATAAAPRSTGRWSTASARPG